MHYSANNLSGSLVGGLGLGQDVICGYVVKDFQ